MSDASLLMPHFFAVGPPRTGTSWLHQRMRGSVSLPSTKETRFFDRNFSRGMEWYAAQFDRKSPHKIMGEMAPTYFYETQARERMASFTPNAKIICSLRDPVKRLYSFYKMKLALAFYHGSFEEFVRDPEVIESTRYAFHVREWQRLFGHENVLVVFYEDLEADPQKYLQEVCSFVGVPAPILTSGECASIHGSESMSKPRSYTITKSALGALRWMRVHGITRAVPESVRKSPKLRRIFLGGGQQFLPLKAETERELRNDLQSEVDEVETLVGRDLSAWKGVNRRELGSMLIATPN